MVEVPGVARCVGRLWHCQAMASLTLGVLADSRKTDEFRLPIHPDHFSRIPAELRAQITVESGYGARFGATDAQLATLVGAVAPRAEVLAASDIVLLPKPVMADLTDLRDGHVLWGWPHVVQDPAFTQVAIDKGLTLIAWEAMNHWTARGEFSSHVFYLNNEIAGYASVLHALTLTGSTGRYGRALSAVVLGFGNTARGAVEALSALGVHDITVLATADADVAATALGSAPVTRVYSMDVQPGVVRVRTQDGDVAAATFLAKHDVIVNCVLQDTDSPMMFVSGEELAMFAPGSLIVDVSCDTGMAFDFARSTTFAHPVVTVGDRVTYYAVDHSPSFLWNSSTWVISEALLPYVPIVMAGPDAWQADVTISRAIEIRAGMVQNPRILSFQGRAAAFPHALL